MAQTKQREFGAGLLLLLAILACTTVIIVMGERPEFLHPTYTLTVEFPTAAGLAKGGGVYLLGTSAGKISSDPVPVADTEWIAMKVKIDKQVVLRRDATWQVINPGFVGDNFITVLPHVYASGEAKAALLENGDIVRGISSTTFESLGKQAVPLLHRVTHAAGELDTIVTQVNTEVLTPDTAGDLRQITQKLPKLVTDAGNVKTNANDLIARIKSNHSAIGEILYDPEVKGDLASFMANYQKNGAVFYHDDSSDGTTNAPDEAPNNATRSSWRSRP